LSVIKIIEIYDKIILFSTFKDGVSLVGGVIGAMHIPEKWFPGCLDYYLNSHNIMHILVVTAVYSMHQVNNK
jgi:predicted membrane channel-forming protein YqfA (hemolysin III family)